MALLAEIGAMLSTAGVASSSGESGWYLALSLLPDSTVWPDKTVAVIQGNPGYAPDAATEVDRPVFQVLTRGESPRTTSSAYQDCETKARAAYTALHAKTPGSYSSHHYTGIWAEQEPFFAGYDDSDRVIFSQNFRAMRSRT